MRGPLRRRRLLIAPGRRRAWRGRSLTLIPHERDESDWIKDMKFFRERRIEGENEFSRSLGGLAEVGQCRSVFEGGGEASSGGR